MKNNSRILVIPSISREKNSNNFREIEQQRKASIYDTKFFEIDS